MAGEMGTDANDILMELMLQVDNDTPVTREVTLKLNELADVVASSSPDVRKNVLELGAYAIVCRAWIYCCYSGSSTNAIAPGGKQCRNAVLRTLYALTPGHPDIIDDVGWQIITQAVDKSLPEQTQILVLKLLQNIFIKSEDNREQFCWNLDMLEPLLLLPTKPRVTNSFLREWCYCLKALILNDDVRETANRASERKRTIASAEVLPNLASRLSHHTLEDGESDVDAMNAIVVLLASMAVNDALCLSIESGNAIPGIHNLFKLHLNNKTLMHNTVSLLRFLCVNQEVRDKAATSALMKYVIDVLNYYQNNKEMVQVTMYCCAYMTLRSPCQVAQFLAKGGLHTTLQLMNAYPKDFNILKPACLTLRNVSDNGEDSRAKMKELGFTVLLTSLMSTVPHLREFYIVPLLRQLGYSTTSFLEDHVLNQGPEDNVPMEPRVGRRSVVFDEDK